MTDGDVDEHIDPELDPTPARGGLPGPVTLPRLVFGLHVATAIALGPFAIVAYRLGNLTQLATLGVLMLLLVAAGVVAARIVDREYR